MKNLIYISYRGRVSKISDTSRHLAIRAVRAKDNTNKFYFEVWELFIDGKGNILKKNTLAVSMHFYLNKACKYISDYTCGELVTSQIVKMAKANLQNLIDKELI